MGEGKDAWKYREDGSVHGNNLLSMVLRVCPELIASFVAFPPILFKHKTTSTICSVPILTNHLLTSFLSILFRSKTHLKATTESSQRRDTRLNSF